MTITANPVADRPVPPPFADELHPDWCTATDARGCGVCGNQHTWLTGSLGADPDDRPSTLAVAAVMRSDTGSAGIDVTIDNGRNEVSAYMTVVEAEALIAALQQHVAVAKTPVRRAIRPAAAR